MSLSEVRENNEAVITAISGDTRFMSRITSIGLTPGCIKRRCYERFS